MAIMKLVESGKLILLGEKYTPVNEKTMYIRSKDERA